MGNNGATEPNAGAQNAPAAPQNVPTPETGNGAAGASNGNSSPQTGAGENLSAFDKFLQTEGMQAEFDRRVAKALDTQKNKLTGEWQSQIEKQVQEAVTEAQKLMKMTKDQQEDYARQKREEELTKREAEITRRELVATAKDTLASKGLPVTLADVLNYTDANSVNQSIEAVEKAFQKSVQSSVEEKLKGGRTPEKAQNAGGDDIAQIIHNSIKSGFYR